MLSIPEAFRVHQSLRDDTRILFASEPPDVEASMERLIRLPGTGTSSRTDAYLSAFCQQAGHTLVMFDQGFQRWLTLRLEVLVGS